MKTYVLDVDGVPAIAFRAASDEEAGLCADGRLFVPGHIPEGPFTVRPATFQEQAKWRAASVQDSLDSEDEETRSSPKHSLDGLLVRLGDEEEQEQGAD